MVKSAHTGNAALTASDIVRAHLAAEDSRDLEATMATFAERCWYGIPTRGLRLVGRDAVRRHYAELFAAFPDLVNEDVTLYDAGSRVFGHIRVRRRHEGAWGEFAPTGRIVVTHALAEFIIAGDGLLEAEVVHMNPLEALCQIGASPTEDVMQLASEYQRLLSGA
jgi:hypothetical protein